MKQSSLKGKTQGLRPSQKRRLETLSHRRHPLASGADQLTLERLAQECIGIRQNLHLIIDSRGLCRILWVGFLDHAKDFLYEIRELSNCKKSNLRLISCIFMKKDHDLQPNQKDLISALDLAPSSWLIFSPINNSAGLKSGKLWVLDPTEKKGWKLLEKNDLENLCRQTCFSLLSEKNINLTEKGLQERVLLLTQSKKDYLRSQRDLAELEGLVRSAGACPIGTINQKKNSFSPQTIWGTGKLKEIALEVRRKNASLVLTDRDLTPAQARNLEEILSCPVMDRSELILDIFAQRASTANGRLQVELAQLRYRLPRLVGRGKTLSRQGGGIGTRGPGETQLEKDRRVILRRIEKLGRDLDQLETHRARLRNKRKSLPRVALVGYTNAGKSSLLNSLCNLNQSSQVFSANKLFATLDPMTRRLTLPREGGSPDEILITDTVGFINDLPSSLLEAFSSTLEETRDSDLLLLLADLSNPDWKFQLQTVDNLLNSLGATKNRQVLANKIDLCESSALKEIRNLYEKVFYVSATSGAGLKGLRTWLREQFWIDDSKMLSTHESSQ